MSKKLTKSIIALGAICASAAGIIYMLKKKENASEEEFADNFEDEDFDLDDDLAIPADREYVSLNQADAEEAIKTNDESAEATK